MTNCCNQAPLRTAPSNNLSNAKNSLNIIADQLVLASIKMEASAYDCCSSDFIIKNFLSDLEKIRGLI
jgi:hypothetical protein